MSNQKPVWRVNTGRGVPRDFDSPSKILTRKQYGVSVIINTHNPAATWAWDRFYLRAPVISAYQTNRTRAAKYERVKCDSCGGSRFKGMVFCGGYFEYRECSDCNGTGSVRRKINGN